MGLCHYFRRTHRPTQAITGGNTDGIVSSVFHREFEKNYGLCHSFRLTHRPTQAITNGNTDGTIPSVFHREFDKNYGLVPLFPTESPTTITDGNHRWKLHIPKRTPVRATTITDGRSVGNCRRNYRRIKTKGGIFENFGAHFNLFPVGITDRNKCHRQHLMFRR
jgi:hypothetical protein